MDRQHATRELEQAQHELRMLALEATMDVAGVFDPTPTSDLVAASLALSRGDLWGAGLSLLSVIPYAGDAIGKPLKASKIAIETKRLRDKIERIVQRMADNPRLDVSGKTPPSSVSVAKTDKGASQLGRDLPLPPGAADFSAWRGRRVIDSGAGGGSFVRELRAQGVDAYGFDIVSETFRKAGVRQNDHFIQASADKIPMAANTFDAATSNWSVFYYFERGTGAQKTATYLSELARVVKPGGELRLFGVDPHAADVFRRSSLVTVEEIAAQSHGTIPFVRLRVRGSSAATFPN